MHFTAASNASGITCLPAWYGAPFGLKSHFYLPILLSPPPHNHCTYCNGIFYKPEVNLVLAGKCNSSTDVARRQTTCIPCAVRVEAKDLEQGFKFPTKMGWPGASPAAASPACSPGGFHGGRRTAGYLLKGTASLVRFISSPPVLGTLGK